MGSGGADQVVQRMKDKIDSLDLYGHIRTVHPSEFFLCYEVPKTTNQQLAYSTQLLRIDRNCKDETFAAVIEPLQAEHSDAKPVTVFNQAHVWIPEE